MRTRRMLFPGARPKALTLSYDDNVEQDARLMEIMDAHGIKGTFNLDSGLFSPEGTVYTAGVIHRKLTEKAAVALYKNSGHEVAVHGVNHPFLTQLPVPEAMLEVLEDRRALEGLFGGIVRGMAYPYGDFNDALVEGLRSCGIAYARTVKCTGDFSIPTDWLRLKATCHHNSPELMRLADRFVNEQSKKNPWLFYLWGHSFEFEQNDNWDVIERFCEAVGGREDIWYATNIEIYDYIQSYERLQFSVDGQRVHNPSANTVWMRVDGTDLSVAPGETKEL